MHAYHTDQNHTVVASGSRRTTTMDRMKRKMRTRDLRWTFVLLTFLASFRSVIPTSSRSRSRVFSLTRTRPSSPRHRTGAIWFDHNLLRRTQDPWFKCPSLEEVGRPRAPMLQMLESSADPTCTRSRPTQNLHSGGKFGVILAVNLSANLAIAMIIIPRIHVASRLKHARHSVKSCARQGAAPI